MRTKIHVIIACLFASLCFSCSSNTGKWDRYTAKDGAFSVFMPATPEAYDRTEVTAFGKQVVHYVTWKPATFELNKFRLFQVSYTDCPAQYTSDSARLNAALDSSINLRKKDFTEEVDIPTQPVEQSGYRGREFIFDPAKTNVITIVKVFIANHKRFALTVIAKKDYPTNAEVGNFFNSFQVLK